MINSGLTASGKPSKAKVKPPPSTETKPARKPLKASAPNKATETSTPTSSTRPSASNKRKRAKNLTKEDGSSELSDLSDVSEPEDLVHTTANNTNNTPDAHNGPPPGPPTPTILTMTKSGRQVQKPTTYNPAAVEAASAAGRRQRQHYGKRTAEQALCKRCSRMHSPASNQMVFCDGCNDGWHQMCHEPPIDDATVRDRFKAWFCAPCVAKREQKRQKRAGNKGDRESGNGSDRGQQHVAKKLKVEHQQPPKKESWAFKTMHQKRAYLSTLSQQDLVGLLMTSLELHPDLPIFPSSASTPTVGTPKSLFGGSTTEGLFPRVDAQPDGPINYIRKIPTNGGTASPKQSPSIAGGAITKEGEEVDVVEEDDDPLLALWPKMGMGLYHRLLPPDVEDDEHLVDGDDYEAFSVIVYDVRGRKVMENGMKV